VYKRAYIAFLIMYNKESSNIYIVSTRKRRGEFWDLEEKGIGRQIGRAARQGRRAGGRKRRGSGKPLDGDGDGFYSPRPGAPDKTPVPAGMALDAVDAPKKPKPTRNWKERIGDRLADAADELDRTKPKERKPKTPKPEKPKEPKKPKERGGNWLERIADRLDPDKENDGKKKRKPRPYDDLTGHEKILSMYDEMAKEHGVPKTRGEAEEILKKSFPNVVVEGNPEERIRSAEAASVLAMMASAEYFPEATELLEAFRIGDKNDNDGALASAGITGTGTFFISLKKRLNNDSKGRREFLVASQMAYAAKDAGASDEEARRIIAMGATVHELVHMQHFAKQVDWLGGKKEAVKKLGNLTDEELQTRIQEVRDGLKRLYRERSDEELERLGMVRADLTDEGLLKNVMRMELARVGRHFVGKTKRTMYDSLSEEEILESRKAMNVSTYARQDDMEGAAESITARLMGLEAPDNPMHQWVAPDVKADNDEADDDLKFQTCRGFNTGPPGREDAPDREEK
jgi:arsenate reductase-like glutaredoxin family protein